MWIRVAIAATVLAVSLPASLSAQPAGEAVSVKQSASADGTAGSRVLQLSDPVFMGDMVKTNRVGLAQIKLMDDTKLVVGPNSQMEIDSFIFAGQNTAQDVTINAVQGTFRFITGKSQKQAYTINTPVASIGVRGTEFDLTMENGILSMALYGGGVRVCDYSVPRQCAELDDSCGVIILDPREGYRWERDVYAKTRMMDEVFPYALRQQPLRADFRVESRGCEYRNTTPGPRSSGAQTSPTAPSGGGGDGGGGGGCEIC